MLLLLLPGGGGVLSAFSGGPWGEGTGKDQRQSAGSYGWMVREFEHLMNHMLTSVCNLQFF